MKKMTTEYQAFLEGQDELTKFQVTLLARAIKQLSEIPREKRFSLALCGLPKMTVTQVHEVILLSTYGLTEYSVFDWASDLLADLALTEFDNNRIYDLVSVSKIIFELGVLGKGR